MNIDPEATANVVQALGHPLRVRVLAHLAERDKASPSEMAETWGEPLGNVSYHVRQLHRLGVIKPAGQRPRRGAVEHYYRLSGDGTHALAALHGSVTELLIAARGPKVVAA